jgi:branched-chain amino acid transport system substrate-binding protein
MGHPEESSRGAATRRRRALAVGALLTLLLAVAACGNGDDDGSSNTPGPADAEELAQLLGPEDQASGEPVRIGMITDGMTQAFDARDELRAVEATAQFWNEHRGGIGGRPIEVVSCETGADPAGGTDCANQMVDANVVAVALGQSTVAESIWEPLHQAGIPSMFFQAAGDDLNADPDTSFVISNPLTTAFGLPISVAEDEGTDEVAFVVIDVPVAVTFFESFGQQILENAGLDYELVRVPPGTADMTSQMSEIVDSPAGVVQVIGNDAFCIAAFQGLSAAGYDGRITAISQCITDATRQAIPADQLQGMYVTSMVALGAADDPTYQLYEAVMSTYGQDVEDVANNVPMVGYTVMATLATSLEGISGDITPATVAQTIKAAPDQALPGGGGLTFRCGGSAMATWPAVCTNQWLRATLDADGQPADYEAVDSTEILEGL